MKSSSKTKDADLKSGQNQLPDFLELH